jgi:DNA-binding MarR family transcriptional regulator
VSVALHNWNFYRLASSHRAKLGETRRWPQFDRLTNRITSSLAEFRYRLRGFLKFSEHEAAKIGLNPQQHQALLAIKGAPRGHVTIGILAERLGIRHNSAVELIDRLITNGLAVRRPNPEDRREVLIHLTNRAERILAKLTLAHRDEVRKLAPLLRRLLEPFESGPRKARHTKRKTYT